MRSLAPFLVLAPVLAVPVDLSQVSNGPLSPAANAAPAPGGIALPSAIDAASQLSALGAVALSLCLNINTGFSGAPLALPDGVDCSMVQRLASVPGALAAVIPTTGADPSPVASGVPRLNAAIPQGAPSSSEASNDQPTASQAPAPSSQPSSSSSSQPSKAAAPQKAASSSPSPAARPAQQKAQKSANHDSASSKPAAKSTKPSAQQKPASRPSPSPSPARQQQSPPPSSPSPSSSPSSSPSPSPSPAPSSQTPAAEEAAEPSSSSASPAVESSEPSVNNPLDPEDCPLDCVLKLADNLQNGAPGLGDAAGGLPGVIHLGALPVDPTSGLPVDPTSGLPVDPTSGLPVDPTSGLPVDPTTGLPVNPTAGGLPIDPNSGASVPVGLLGGVPPALPVGLDAVTGALPGAGNDVPCDENGVPLSISVKVNGSGGTECEECEENA